MQKFSQSTNFLGAYLDFKALYISVPNLGQKLYDKTQKWFFFQLGEISNNKFFKMFENWNGWVNSANQSELQSPLKL